ncbi:hypothetical protein BDZ45DRAFT_679463 [Acephala macrosclerotiorum]|nr:hypothetical protein BDZ45DRAFT_679463 [Acephala macrosclerotiorum]
MTEEARCQELTMIEVWDTTEKFNRTEKWLADVNGYTIPPDQVHAPLNPWGYFKPFKSALKRARKEEIESGLVQDFPMPIYRQRVMVSMTVKQKLEDMEDKCQSLMVYQRFRWRCPWDDWQWRVLQGRDDDSDQSTITYWEPKHDVVDEYENSKDEAFEDDEGYDADEEDTG